MVGVELLEQAKSAGLEISVRGNRLVIRGPRSAESLAQSVLAHKAQILALIQPEVPAASIPSQLETLRAERERLSARWHKGMDFLEEFRQQHGQDGKKFDDYLAEWSKIDEAYRRTCDQIAEQEAIQELNRWGYAWFKARYLQSKN